MLVTSTGRYNIVAVTQHRENAVLHRQNFHLARFNLGNIQYVVNQRKKRMPRILNVQGVVPQVFILTFLEEHGIHSKDSVNRRPDFMAHIG